MREKTELSIRGKKINYEHRMIDIDDVSFYERNPRVATIVSEHKGPVSDQVIDKCLWEKDETHKLKRQIEKDGGLVHPIVVYKREVLEGNTRLCCYRHLYQESKDSKWKSIRCHVILDELTQEDIYRLLCTEHISGKIEWDAYDKANLFCKMKQQDGLSVDEISEITGEPRHSIYKKIRAYELMVKHGVVAKEKYSHFEQLVGSGPIRNIRRSIDPDIEDKVIGLIKNGTLRKATDIRSIGTIYKHKEARKRVFHNKEDVEQVYYDLKARVPMTDSPIIKEVESLLRRFRQLTREERDGIRNSKRELMKIRQLTKELLSLCSEMAITIHVPAKLRKEGKTKR